VRDAGTDAALETDANLGADGMGAFINAGRDAAMCSVVQPVVAPAACDACVKNKCCEELKDCIASSDCVRLNNAIATCQTRDGGDVASCVDAAKVTFKNGVAAFDAFFSTCLPAGCKSECPQK
jgi:hypothetical protein